ncbi:MAG: hypothetical protein ACQCXQ_10610, partial [Verrucomicrobiales bacterium]
KHNPVSPHGIDTLETRRILLDYRANPDASLDQLIERLGFRFDPVHPDATEAAMKLPTTLDPSLVTEAAFENAAARESKNAPYRKYEPSRLLRELDRVESFDEAEFRYFLSHLDRADHPAVVRLVKLGLALESPVAFGTADLHANLTSGQLAELETLHPALRENSTFNLARLAKLRPGAETDFRQDLPAHAAHLQRCRDYALTLPHAQNSLKAHILYHHLRLQRELGHFPKNDLLAYLALPRKNHSLLRDPASDTRFHAGLTADFAAATGCPPVKDDRDIILPYLHHFLRKSDTATDFAPFIRQDVLARTHAEARLLAGADPQKWTTPFDPESFHTLQQQTRIDFAPGSPDFLAAADPATLTLDLKNTPDLLVRIYEIDLPAHLARTGTQPAVTLDLDGLVPHHQRRLSYPQPPLVLHRESIPLPEINGPGIWLVDLVAGTSSARTLIRKGRLVPFIQRTATAQTIRVFDETGKPVPAATLTLGRETHTARNGLITVPNSASQPVTRGIVRAGKLAVPVQLGSRSDDIKLDTAFHLDREQLLADRKATARIRPHLTNHGHPIPLDRLTDPAIVLKAKLVGAITTERVIADDIDLQPVIDVPFLVPADLLELTLTLRGTVTPATGGDPLHLSSQSTWRPNAELLGSHIAAAFFSPTPDGHILELRGRNGEPVPNHPLTLECSHFDYKPHIKVQVRTDENGRVQLGKMDTFHYLVATGYDIEDALYGPYENGTSTPHRIQIPAGREIRIPRFEPRTPTHISLLETLDGKPVRDHTAKLHTTPRFLTIRDLPPGDFLLRQGQHDKTTIHVSSGTSSHGLLVSQTRILPVLTPATPVITTATAENDTLRITLAGSTPQTRVTITGRHFEHVEWDAGDATGPFAPPVPDTLHPGFTANGYLTNRRLPDETRYILDRRATTTTFPGSMLPRPGILTHRWSQHDIDQGVLPPLDGLEGQSRGKSSRGSSTFDRKSKRRSSSEFISTAPPVCDFLANTSVVKFNLTPDPDGSLTLPLADFAGCRLLEIHATEPFASDTRILPLTTAPLTTRDRRIARPLDPAKNHLATRNSLVLAKGESATIRNLVDADWRAFTTLADAHKLLYGMASNDILRDFIFLTEWPSFPEDKKLELLAAHHCHELHLFLARRDPAFFQKHVKPTLAAKLEPTFIDDFLLGRDLSSYLRPYAWKNLNGAEKALLAHAMPDAKPRVIRELTDRWELENPNPEYQTHLFTQTLRGSDLALLDSLGLARNEIQVFYGGGVESAGVSYLTEKLHRIIIPRIDFEDTTLEEAIDFLRLRTAESDSLELDPSKKGVNIVNRGSGGLKIRELKLKNVPLSQALKYICDATKLRYKVDDFAVTLVPQTETGEDLVTRTYQVPPDFAYMLDSGGGSGIGQVDPFAEPSGQPSSAISRRRPIAELLKSAGINLPPGASATMSANGSLLVTNTPSELEKISQLTQSIACSPVRGHDGFPGLDSSGSFFMTEYEPPELPNSVSSDSDPFAAPSSGGLDPFGVLPPMPGSSMPSRFPEQTKLWRESNYYHHSEPTGEDLIPLRPFWIDLAESAPGTPFLSARFNACTANANESLMCLALLDLPFKAGLPETSVDKGTLEVTAQDPMILFFKDIRQTGEIAEDSPLLVRQSFSPLEGKFRIVNGRQAENTVTGTFRPGTPYHSSLVVTNPTGIGRRIDLLAQIPAGSIPLAGHPATLSSAHEIEPHGVVKAELAFYFPATGHYSACPLQIAENGKLLAKSEPRTLKVTTTPEPLDKADWLAIAAEGTATEVLARLESENLHAINLRAIDWRLADRSFFLNTWKTLANRMFYSPHIAKWGFHHQHRPAMRAYLENSRAIEQLGTWLDSPLLNIRPRTHHDWQTLEFDPLVNPRSHPLGDNPRITHQRAREHYHAFLEQLSWKPRLSATDHLTLAAFLFLQNRVAEALERFAKIDPQALPDQLHYDYLHAVALFYQENPDQARAIAAARIPTLPPGLWHDRFQTVLTQADEIAALAKPNPEPSEESAPPSAPELELARDASGRLLIRSTALEKATVSLYQIDLEMLFSKEPFLGDQKNHQRPSIHPNSVIHLNPDPGEREITIAIPHHLQKGNILAFAESGDLKSTAIVASDALEITHQPLHRTIRITDSATGKPLPKTYIKVYTQDHNGETRFHKDGYTDLRGLFDYLSHTGRDASNVKRIAILASHPDLGARTIIYNR